MEKKEELLERLVNEIAAQNKLIALQIAKEVGKCKFDDLDYLKEDEYLSRLQKRTRNIMAIIYDN